MKAHVIKRQLLKLADAISAGARKRPQCGGHLFRVDSIQSFRKGAEGATRYKLGASCALGAAYEGAFGKPPITVLEYEGEEDVQVNGGEDAMYSRLEKRFPVLRTRVEYSGQLLFDEIIQRNDDGGQPRGNIARWLRKLARNAA